MSLLRNKDLCCVLALAILENFASGAALAIHELYLYFLATLSVF